MLQGINNNSDLYSVYNRIGIRRQQEEEALKGLNQQPQNNKSEAEENVSIKPASSMNLRLDDIKPRQNASLENISLSLNESASSFEMKGRDSDIASLDIKKAVSDMQKDKTLMQYQYFVGESNPFVNTEDGIVIAK